MRRSITNALIASGVLVLLLTGLPVSCAPHEQLRGPLSGALSAIGLCQPQWRLFAPNVHKTNSYLVAEVALADGNTRHWSSPDFRERGLREKLFQGQFPKLYDNLRLDRHRAAWRPFAEWLAREVGAGKPVRSVRLERHFYEIPPPDVADWSALPPPREKYQAHVFYERRWR